MRIEFLSNLVGVQIPSAVTILKKSLESYFGPALNNEAYAWYLAKSGDKIAGVGGMIIREQPGNFRNPSGRMGYVMNMYTVPEFRRKGICRSILQLLVEEGIKKGLTAFELHATKEGEEVYSRNGFTIHHEPTYRKYI